MTGSAVWRGKVQGIWFGIKAWRCGHTNKGFQGAVLPDYCSVLSYPLRNLRHAHILGSHGVPFHCLWTCTGYIKLVACEWWSCSLVWLLKIALAELLKETSVFGAEVKHFLVETVSTVKYQSANIFGYNWWPASVIQLLRHGPNFLVT
jgi:hypothetical protein